MSMERLQKILAHAGVASRRKSEELIEQGKVTVNGKIVRELGSKADLDQDVIVVDGRTIRETQDKVHYLLYKPAGVVTTLSDPEGRKTIKTYLEEISERVYPVGRLDYDPRRGAFRNWLFTIVRRKLSNWRRKPENSDTITKSARTWILRTS